MVVRKNTAYITEELRDFSGGLNTDLPVATKQNELSVAKNVMLTLEGKAKPRPGEAKRFAVDFDSNPVKGISAYYKSDGTTRLVIAAGTSLYADEPHIVFEYDTQSDWEKAGVYTNLDTKSSPGDVKMFTPPQAMFHGTPVYEKIWI